MSATRAQLAGRFLLLEIEDDRWSPSLEHRLGALRPGGVLIRAANARAVETTAEMLARIGAVLPWPAILAFDGGSADSDNSQNALPRLPSPRAAAGRGLNAVARLGELTGAALRLAGFNAVLAPLLDVPPPGADRPGAFSPDPQFVAACGKAYLDGLARHDILACGKFFPGLGGAAADRQSPTPLVGKTMAELWRADLVPYRALHGRLPLVMVGHGAYKAYDFDASRPATISPNVVRGLLREKLGYKGLAVADDIASDAIRGSVDPDAAAVKSLAAGCDLLRLSGSSGKLTDALLHELERGLETGEVPAARAEDALERLQRLRKHLPPRSGFRQREFDRLVRDIEKFNGDFRPRGEKSA